MIQWFVKFFTYIELEQHGAASKQQASKTLKQKGRCV